MLPFIGSDAIARGHLTRGQLRSRYIPMHPDVYIRRETPRTLAVNAHGAALWANAVVTGRAACGLYGVAWVDAATQVELVGYVRHARPGVIVRNQRIAADEIRPLGAIHVATAARAAFDIARHPPRGEALTYLDALVGATGLDLNTVAALATRYTGARGVMRARAILPLVDGGAQSPKENWAGRSSASSRSTAADTSCTECATPTSLGHAGS